MNLNDYEVRNPLGSSLGEELRKLARQHPFRTRDLITALEEFVRSNGESADCIGRSADAAIEIYLVPPRFILRQLPSAAAMVRVNHAPREIRLTLIIEEYGGIDESAQWNEMRELAVVQIGGLTC
jgi:hypothetical protein